MNIISQKYVQNLSGCIRTVSLDNFFLQKKFQYLCYFQLFVSTLLISSQITEFLLPFYAFEGPIYEFFVIVSGIVIGISGANGLWTRNNTTGSRMKFYLIFTILAAYLSASLITYSMIMFIVSIDEGICGWTHMLDISNDYDLYSQLPYGSYKPILIPNPDYFTIHADIVSYIALLLIALIGVIEVGVTSSISMVLCKSLWNRKKRSYDNMSMKDATLISASLAKRRRIIWMSFIQIIISAFSLSVNMTWIVDFENCDFEKVKAYEFEKLKACTCDEHSYFGPVLLAVVPYALCGIIGIVTGLCPTKYFCISLMVLVIVSTLSFIAYLYHIFSRLGEYMFIITYIFNISMILIQAVIGFIQMIFSVQTSVHACKAACRAICCKAAKRKSSVASKQILNDHHIIQTRELSLRLSHMM